MTVSEPLAYPEEPHRRRHGPSGYHDWSSFKPWLRDEFAFCCVFCRVREAWLSPRGADKFGVEHLKPRSIAPELEFVYENMFYACLHCNSYKLDQWPIMDPCRVAYGTHLRVRDDGTIEALTKPGKRMMRIPQLDDEEMNRYRAHMLRLIRHLWDSRENEGALSLYQELMGYPSDLPNLGVLRPGGNSRPEGIQHSHYERRRRGELPEVY